MKSKTQVLILTNRHKKYNVSKTTTQQLIILYTSDNPDLFPQFVLERPLVGEVL